jgi:hypothetical protein
MAISLSRLPTANMSVLKVAVEMLLWPTETRLLPGRHSSSSPSRALKMHGVFREKRDHAESTNLVKEMDDIGLLFLFFLSIAIKNQIIT